MATISYPVEEVQALVVGAGPVGLFAALCAARRGLRVALLDQGFRDSAPGHATLLHGTTLALLHEAGIAEDLNVRGRLIEQVSIYVDGELVRNVALPSPALAVPQSALESALLRTLRSEGVELRPAHRAAALEQQRDHVDVRVTRQERGAPTRPASDGEWHPVESSVIRADFVIGADGYDSRVRSALGIDTVELGNTESYAMFETLGPFEASSLNEELSIDDELSGLLLPLCDGRSRWAFQINRELDANPDVDRLRALIHERARRHENSVERLDWGTVIQFERRLARRFGMRRVWLAGDAAHVTCPLGAHSMNIGLQEVRDLVQRIADSLRDGSGTHLERYASEREHEWHQLFGRNVQFGVLPHAAPWLAVHGRRIVPTLPASGTELAELLAELGLRLN